MIFGQLGNDIDPGRRLDADAVRDADGHGADVPARHGRPDGWASRSSSAPAATPATTCRSTPSQDNGLGTDGSDYIEGGGGSDVIFGNQGQDDIIGGSSEPVRACTDARRSGPTRRT